jgi:hypothetical protein
MSKILNKKSDKLYILGRIQRDRGALSEKVEAEAEAEVLMASETEEANARDSARAHIESFKTFRLIFQRSF